MTVESKLAEVDRAMQARLRLAFYLTQPKFPLELLRWKQFGAGREALFE